MKKYKNRNKREKLLGKKLLNELKITKLMQVKGRTKKNFKNFEIILELWKDTTGGIKSTVISSINEMTERLVQKRLFMIYDVILLISDLMTS